MFQKIRWLKNRKSLIVVLLFYICICWVRLSYQNWGVNNYHTVLSWDNLGYYLYLPANFIYDDPTLQNKTWIDKIYSKYSLPGGFYQAHRLENGNRVIQYTMGMAIIYSPAFCIAHVISKNHDLYEADGFSLPYQLAILIEAVLIVLLGLLISRKLLLCYFSDEVTSIVLTLFLFGTNYFQIVSENTITPHAILFTFYVSMLLLTNKWHQTHRLKELVWIGILLSLITLSRPNEILFLLIFLLWGVSNLQQLKERVITLLKYRAQIILVSVLVLLIGLLQFLYWKNTSGDWFYDSYTNEGFKFLSPYLKEYLFSYKKGWLLYTPMMLFFLTGFYFLYKKNREIFFALTAFTILNIWILSSWDCWWYAASFSQRSIVQSYPVLLIPFGYFISSLRTKNNIKTYTIWLILLGCLLLNQFQTYQQRNGILHTSRMSKEYYWATFGDLKLDVEKFSLLEPVRGVNYLPEDLIYNRKLIYSDSFSEKSKLALNSGRPISKKYETKVKEVTNNQFPFLKGTVRCRTKKDKKVETIGLVFFVKDYRSGELYGRNFQEIQVNDSKKRGEWLELTASYGLPYLRSEKDTIVSLLQLRGNSELELSQFSLELYEPILKKKKPDHFYNEISGAQNGSWVKGILSSGGDSYQIKQDASFGGGLKEKVENIELHDGTFEIELTGKHLQLNNDYRIVLALKNKEGLIHYEEFALLGEQNRWKGWKFRGKLPTKDFSKSELRLYFWNREKTDFLYKGLKLSFLESSSNKEPPF